MDRENDYSVNIKMPWNILNAFYKITLNCVSLPSSFCTNCLKDDPQNLLLKTIHIAPFDLIEGKRAGKYHAILQNKKSKLKNIDRPDIKDGCIIPALIANKNNEAFITKDKSSFSKIIGTISKRTSLKVAHVSQCFIQYSIISHLKQTYKYDRIG